VRQLLRMVKVNGLQYNPNRDPQPYRRTVNEPFRIEAMVAGGGPMRCRLTDQQGAIIVEKTVDAPGTFYHELSFAAPGVRLVTLEVESAGESFAQNLRLDVLDHAWVG
jgi:hypothetical protein